ncbi:unnamed protein product [Polarella glacialis]|uniref:Uncharacterized protein n=1 Tax=Polarella glacialis TaxID=89957 RepID=A0A813GGJ3_POLGL|nr:unnamed protein product [Polarella glacialis]
MLPSCTSALWQGMVRHVSAVLSMHLRQELHSGSFLLHFKACSCMAMPTLRKRALMGIGHVALTGLHKTHNVAAWLASPCHPEALRLKANNRIWRRLLGACSVHNSLGSLSR